MFKFKKKVTKGNIFCKECKYFKATMNKGIPLGLFQDCNSYFNKVIKQNHYTQYEDYISVPRIINENNNCKFFEQKKVKRELKCKK